MFKKIDYWFLDGIYVEGRAEKRNSKFSDTELAGGIGFCFSLRFVRRLASRNDRDRNDC